MGTTSNTHNGVIQVMRLAILALILVYLVLPLFLLGGLTGFGKILVGNYGERILDAWDGTPAVGTRINRVELDAQEDRLISISSYDGEARASANALHVVVVDFDFGAQRDQSQSPKQAAHGDQKRGFHAVKLNLAFAETTAVLVIAGQPVDWTLTTSPSKPRALLAFEGSSPLEVSGGYEGLLAGYRVAPYGDWNTTRPSHLIEGTDAGSFCSSLKTWRKHFGIERKDVWLSVIRNPVNLTVTNLDLIHDGSKVENIPAINLFCRSW